MVNNKPSYQAYLILRWVFSVLPIVAGADKFLHALCNWDKYLAPWISNLFAGIGVHNLMHGVGILEIITGLIIAGKPRVGAWIFFCWLWVVIINLITYPGHFDIALRDFGLSFGALALARLSAEFEHADIRRRIVPAL